MKRQVLNRLRGLAGRQDERAEQQPAIVDNGEEHMRGNYIGLGARPDDSLERFDRVHVIPGKSATVIDYKTNDCSLEHLKEMYQGQMDLYRISVAKLCGLSPDKVRCVLVHVRQGAIVEC